MILHGSCGLSGHDAKFERKFRRSRAIFARWWMEDAMMAAAVNQGEAQSLDLRIGEITADFTVRAAACPHVVNRLLNFFAQQDMIPAAVRAVRRGDEITLFVRQREIAEPRAEVIAEKMRSLVMVGSVELECQLH
jgi:hypothetical protein